MKVIGERFDDLWFLGFSVQSILAEVIDGLPSRRAAFVTIFQKLLTPGRLSIDLITASL